AKLSAGTLRVSDADTVDLPADPQPGTTLTGTTAAGDAFTVVLNQQEEQGTAITVTAVHISLHGPTMLGQIELAETACHATATATGDPQMAAGASPGDPATSAPPASSSPGPAPPGDAPVSAAIVGTTSLFSAQQVTAVSGLAFNYFTNVSLFGGPANLQGYGQAAGAPSTAASPSVTCPAGGGNPTATDPDGARSTYGPATIFGGIWPDDNNVAPPSGPLTSSVNCRLGEDGLVTATTRAARNPAGTTWTTPPGSVEAWPGGVGPDPFHADAVTSTCTKRADGTTSASTTVANGVLVTSTDGTQLPKTQQDVPTSPPANYTREGTIDHVGDRWRIVLNEQATASDGTITVSAAHMYLLGPTAVGDQVIGQVRCGLTAVQGTSTTSSTTGAGPTSSTTAGAGSSSTASSGSGSGAVAATGAGATTGSGAGSGSSGSASVTGASTA
ncbi:MAG: hypothetical protein ACRD0S_09340, partial [Acidimicrobiales bacterium]